VGDGLADLWPRIAYDSAGRANLAWVKRRVPLSATMDDVVDHLYLAQYSGGSWTTPAVAVAAPAIVEPALFVDGSDNLVVLWQARSLVGMDLWYAVYDRAAGQWSRPIQFTNDTNLQWAYRGYINASGKFDVFFLNREVTTTTVPSGSASLSPDRRGVGVRSPNTIIAPAFGASSLGNSSRTLGRDLTVDALTLSNANPAPGSSVTITATVRNSGDLTVTPVRVGFYDDTTQIGSMQTLGTSLAAGITATLSINWTVPITPTAHTLKAKVDPNDEIAETVETNNELTRITVLPDLVVDWARTVWATNAITVTAGVRNAGVSATTSAFNVTLRADNPITGTAVVTTNIGALLNPGQSTTATLALTNPAAILTGAHTGWVIADSGNAVAEANETNNTVTSALNILPDLTLTSADIQSSPSVTIAVRNSGFTAATDVLVQVRRDAVNGALLASQTIPSISADGTASFNVSLAAGDYTLFVRVDPANAIAELDESNNLAMPTTIPPSRHLYLPLVMR
jgi:hypothetical protein